MKIRNNLYKGSVQLLFDSFRHAYTDTEGKVPSVTAALGIINKPALVNWAANTAVDYISEQIEPGKSYDEIQLQTIWEGGKKAHYQKKTDAGNIGTFVHKWVEQYIKGENPGEPVNEGLKESVGQFLGWVEKHKVEFLVSEQIIFSQKYRYSGTLDFICKIDGEMFIGDLKTSSGIYPEYFIQTAAYRHARHEEFPEENYKGQLIVRIGKDGEFEFAKIKDDARYRQLFVGFLAALKLYETMEELKEFHADKE